MKSIITLALVAIATTASANYTIILDTGEYTIQKDGVVLHGEGAPVPVVPVVPPVVDEPPVVVPPVVDEPPVVVPPPVDEPPVTPPVVVPPPVVDEPPVVTPPPVVVPTGKLIPGGIKTAPVVISASGDYVIAGDMECVGNCIEVAASNVLLNLNGKRLVYNTTAPGSGVVTTSWNKQNVHITNGTIVQGTLCSEGDVYGRGNNPIQFSPYTIYKMKVSNVRVEYCGRDVSGITGAGADGEFLNNTLVDLWTNGAGTLKNRHQGVPALTGSLNAKMTGGKYIGNTLIGARQQGIRGGSNAIVANNNIAVMSMATNAAGINVGPGSKVYGNTITGRGEHPIGIFYSEASALGVEIYGNTIDLQTTALGDEYGGDSKCFNPATPCGNYANGFRVSWNGKNVKFYDNTIRIRANARYQGRYNPTGAPVVVDGKARGVMIGMDYPDQYALIANNVIEVIDETPGLGVAIGLGCSANTGGTIEYRGNKVTTNGTHVAFGDYYGKCLNYPIVADNEFIKVGDNPKYQTFEAAWEGYSDGTGRVLQNIYSNGASPDRINLWPAKRGKKSVYFGAEVPGAPAQAGLPFDGAGAVYQYELHNTGSTTLKKRQL